MNVISTLNEELLKQPFAEESGETALLAEYQYMTHKYAEIENAIAVLSDLKSNKSYIYHGGVSQKLGIAERGSIKEINSIWEEDILNRIHPEDLMAKHTLELYYFHLLKTIPIEERADYHATNKMRIRDNSGAYVVIHHRMFYVRNCPLGNLWLALCLYNHSYEENMPENYTGFVFNSATGEVIAPDKQKCNALLTAREKEVLLLIGKGETSKEIADTLFISKNTIDRHRQNILEKLRVKNSIEAYQIAKVMGIL